MPTGKPTEKVKYACLTCGKVKEALPGIRKQRKGYCSRACVNRRIAWSRRGFKCCRKCGTTTVPCQGYGYCLRCYQTVFRAEYFRKYRKDNILQKRKIEKKSNDKHRDYHIEDQRVRRALGIGKKKLAEYKFSRDLINLINDLSTLRKENWKK